MSENTNIEWCHHTFNPWHGCYKVSAGCRNCYAERLSKRFGPHLAVWGPKGARRQFPARHWDQPRTWDRRAAAAGERHRVFCGSMCDVFEDRADLVEPRDALFSLIRDTPNLIWMLLSKRPENIPILFPGDFPPNVWLGVSVEDRTTAQLRIPPLLAAKVKTRFLSVEPLLGPIDLTLVECHRASIDALAGRRYGFTETTEMPGVDLVIVGGESGPGCRPMSDAWVRDIRDQCISRNVAFFFKQWGGVRKGGRPATIDGQYWRQLPCTE